MTKLFKIVENPKLKTSEIVALMRKDFKVYVYSEENLDINFPAPKKVTTRYFKKNQEADEEWANKSANDIEKLGLTDQMITLRERLFMELAYFQ